jgi:DNA (cytosine-5)-methyltransferase 1
VKAYYNEHDPGKAAWLRELIRRGLIAPGTVDERDILDVVPAELVGYRQCHFFAGVGTWSYALRCAGWPDDRPAWTVSCPCQPFSAAGKGAGFADERHLWPAWFHLAGQCRPDVVFGEQVEGDDGLAWLDLVWTDMEALGYAFGPVVLPAAGVGAPHPRHRIWFVAESDRLGRAVGPEESGPEAGIDAGIAVHGRTRPLADADGTGQRSGRGGGREPEEWDDTRGGSTIERLADDHLGHADGLRREQHEHPGVLVGTAGDEPEHRRAFHGEGSGGAGPVGLLADALLERPQGPDAPGPGEGRAVEGPGPVNGFWAGADWLPCTDGKARPVESGTFPLADGAPARVVRLRGYGDGIVAQAAEAVIRAYMETRSRQERRP